MPLSVYIREALFSDETRLTFHQGDIVLFVGPNNSGKTTALRDIHELVEKELNTEVVKDVTILRDGTAEELLAWFHDHSRLRDRRASEPVFERLGRAITATNVTNQWTAPKAVLFCFLCHLATADERLTAANPAPNIPVTRQALTHPIQYLYHDVDLEDRMSRYFKRAFGQELIVHRDAGNEIPLYCGDRPQLEGDETPHSRSYLERIEALPLAHAQGDGMRSFLGCLLNALVIENFVVLIDEPEAFLHPPQARLIGTLLGRQKPEGRQLFLATHSGDFLRGLLDVSEANIRVVRLRREGDVNVTRELEPERVRELWKDPLLRYSNVLDGLFHETVVLCEGDADCRFYAAMMDALLDKVSDATRPDIMFLNCSGKSRMPLVVEALRSLHVPVRVIADFDLLQDVSPLRDIVEALGGEWTTIEGDFGQLKQSVESQRPELSTENVREQISRILDDVTERNIPTPAVREMQAILRRTSAWQHIKEVGKSIVPPGQPTQTCDRLLQRLADLGLFIVEIGELESFDRSVGGHGPRWVNSVLEKNLYEEPNLHSAREFIRKVIPEIPVVQAEEAETAG